MANLSSSLIGVCAPRCDALSKARGKERYATDYLPPNVIYAGVRRAGTPCGELLRIEADAALALPGVLKVLTASDVPGSNRQGIVHKDQPVLARRFVRHCGEAVALVLAESRQALIQGIKALELDIAEREGVFDAEQARQPGARLVHQSRSDNILLRGLIEKGDAAEALAQSPVLIEAEYFTPMQEHAFLETQNGLARLRPDGILEMIVSTQAPFRDRFEIAQALGLDPGKIHIKAPYLGGGFGGKDGATVQCLLALAALALPGRWVRMDWERPESILAGYKRHAARIRHRLGADKSGKLLALDCLAVYDSGAYAHLGGEIMELGLEFSGGAYNIPHCRSEGYCVYTNNPVAGAFRGFGVMQTSFAIERSLDALAAKLGMNPLEIRLKNALRPGEANSSGVVMDGSAGIIECLEKLAQHPLWQNRDSFKARAGAFKRRGLGLAAAINPMGYGRGLPDAAAAKLELTTRGSFRIYNSVPDMGQGNASAFCQIAAETLNQELSSLELHKPDTRVCLPSGSSSASRTTYTFGNALIRACRAMRERLKARAALVLLKDEPHKLKLEPGRISDPQSGRAVSLRDMARLLSRDDRICIEQFVMPVVENPPQTGQEFALGFPHRYAAHAAHLCAIEADELSGEVTLLALHSVVEGGAVLNPQGVEQQIQGATAQGAGLALWEDLGLAKGRMAAGDLSTYLIPTALDLPDIGCEAVSGHEPSGPFGLKGLGEVGVHGPPAALAGAVEDALGLCLRRLPVSPEEVLRAASQRSGS